MKKIAIVIGDAYSYAGTENICNFMSDSLGDDFSITILSMKGEGDTFYPFKKVKNIVSFQDDSKPLNSIRENILANDYDTVFVISMGKLSFLFRLLFIFKVRVKNKTKFISCEHIAFDSFSNAVKILKIFSLKWYDVVVVLTETDRIKLGKYGINTKKINNPINYHYHKKEQRYYTALSVGRLNHQKGFDKLLLIWSEFIKTNSNWILNIAGDGELCSELVTMTKELRIENNVKFLGRVKDLSLLYQESDVFLMTSRYEGLPMVLLESKSWALPVIAFDCPTGPREIINHKEDGFLIENDNNESFLKHLNMISNSDELLFDMSKATINTFKEFDAEKIKREWCSLVNNRK